LGDANISWETWQGRAYNKTIAPDLDRIEKIRQVWNQWCTDGRRGIRFMNPAKYGEVSNDYVRIIEGTPTIIRIGDDDDLELSTTV
jgi:hypothetical protein